MGQSASFIDDPPKPTSHTVQLTGCFYQRTGHSVTTNGLEHLALRCDVIDSKRCRSMRSITLHRRTHRRRPTNKICRLRSRR